MQKLLSTAPLVTKGHRSLEFCNVQQLHYLEEIQLEKNHIIMQ